MSIEELDNKISIIQNELEQVEEITKDIVSKARELALSEVKMGTLIEAFEAQLKVLQEQKESQPELI
jgi:hypothetical protein|tara:strand:- start:5696 stop:5896 length:201 start_codon:yes stop_codon:yes gene_type:complete